MSLSNTCTLTYKQSSYLTFAVSLKKVDCNSLLLPIHRLYWTKHSPTNSLPYLSPRLNRLKTSYAELRRAPNDLQRSRSLPAVRTFSRPAVSLSALKARKRAILVSLRQCTREQLPLLLSLRGARVTS